MIKDNQNELNRLRVLLDLFTMAGAYYLTYLLFFYAFGGNSLLGGIFSQVTSRDYLLAAFYILPVHLVLYWLLKLYKTMRVTGRRLEAFKVFEANLISLLIIVLFFWLFIKDYSVHFSRKFLFEFGFINTCAIVLQRNLLRMVVIHFRKNGFNKKVILAVGYSRACEALLDRVQNNAKWGYEVYGILDDHEVRGKKYREYSVIGTVGDLPGILSENNIDEVFVTIGLREYEKLEEIVAVCEKAGVQTKFVPDYGNLMSSRPYTEDLVGLPVIYVRQVPLNDLLNAFLKRLTDVLGALFAIVLFSPLMAFTAIMIKLTSPGPVIFRQERIGLHNRPFIMYKFRSMKLQTEEDEEKGWTIRNDPRVTRFGAFIRKTSIDELPQLFNVLIGKMSLVGPRPERPQFVEKFKEEIPRYMVKHQVRPGMTGWAQVNGLRGDTSIAERINCDLYYIENWSLGLDFKILVLTFFKGFINKNAY